MLLPPSEKLEFSTVALADFEELVELRIAAMRESLERVGRFDPARARERLRKTFYPEHTRFIVYGGKKIGFYTFRPAEDCLQLDHLYVHPDHQSKGVGSSVAKKLAAEADALRRPIRVGALRNSASNRFYQRHGFAKEREDEWDIYYIRQPATPSGNGRP